MATNPYTNFITPVNEQTLFADMYKEVVQFFGQDFYYIPRTLVKEDLLFHEDIMSSFDTHYVIEMFIESFNGYEGQDDFIAGLGLQIDDKLKLSVHGSRFTEETSMTKPQEGDLIWYPTGKALFEVQFVEDEEAFYQLGKVPSFKLTCVLFRYNNNDMNTGISEVDAIETQFDISDTGIDPFSSNDAIQTEADTVLVFDPANPFGSY